MTRDARYKRTGLLTGLVATALLVGCGQRAGETATRESHAEPEVADAARPETSEKSEAAHLSEADFGGAISQGVALVDFWATWCPPCVAEVPVLKRLHAATKDRDDFILLSISLDAKRSDVERFIKKNGVTWHQAVGETAGAHRAAAAFGVSAIPATFLIGPDGKLVATGLRGEGLVEAVQQYLKPAK